MNAQLAFLGIGRMGQVCLFLLKATSDSSKNTNVLPTKAMTANLVSKICLSKPLILYNRSRQCADEHSSKIGNSIVVSTVKEAISQSDIIWTCLKDQEAVLEIFEQILTADIDITGKLFLECSTILPEITSRLGQRILDDGAEFVAMPGTCASLRHSEMPEKCG